MQETSILYFKDELSYQEIAERLSISYDNVRKRISQARKILQQRYDQDFLGEKYHISTNLNERKSPASSRSLKSTKSENLNQIEACTGETFILSEELEKVQIALAFNLDEIHKGWQDAYPKGFLQNVLINLRAK